MRHTPGPWKVYDAYSVNADVVAFVRIGTDSATVLQSSSLHNVDITANVADIHLIAAAPEMLEALERGVGLFCREVDDGISDSFGDFMASSEQWCIDAGRIIAKARGE